MKEQSHKDEMSAALRGDFARLRDRGVAPTLAPREGERRQPAAIDPSDPDPPEASEPPAGRPPEAEEPVTEPGFFARMLGR
ncbi:MAG TPA: hypothetical protein VLB86_01575 [Gaiellaceae bacterium]|nr:hypothetical protein [Gaiellaceae bacterium]